MVSTEMLQIVETKNNSCLQVLVRKTAPQIWNMITMIQTLASLPPATMRVLLA